MERVAPADVRDAACSKGITRVFQHNCSLCNYPCGYIIDVQRKELFFDGGCYCVSDMSEPRPVPWLNAAQWINMQDNPEHRREIMGLFGMEGN